MIRKEQAISATNPTGILVF